MYEYKYVEATLGGYFTQANHHEMVDNYERYDKEGWNIVEAVAINYNVQGKTSVYEIIFLREIEE